MTTRSRLSFGVRVLCGGVGDIPLPDGLPEHVIYEVVTNCETQMLIDLNLSDQNRRVSSRPIPLSPNTFDFALNAANLSVPAFAQLRISPTDTWQDPVDVINLASIDQAGIEGRLAVAFYGNPLRVRLSWIPDSQQVLTVWFDRTIDVDGALTAEPAIEDAYTVQLKLQSVAQCLELMGKSIGDALKAMIMKGERQWTKYVRSSGQQGLVSKPSSHPRARSGAYRGFQRPGGGAL